jgi:ketosteroid isomerase-like protein
MAIDLAGPSAVFGHPSPKTAVAPPSFLAETGIGSLIMRLVASLVSLILMLAAGAAAADENLEETARAALVAFTAAVVSGPDAVAPLLAPEYQIMRANGVGYDRSGYIANVKAVEAAPDFSHEDLVVTAADDVMVVRYFLTINEIIEGSPVSRRAPRLTVFRKIDGDWKVVSHANFGATAPPQ